MNSEKYIEKNTSSMILNLQKLVAQPSVSATGDGIEKCAKLVADLLKRSGIPSEILRIGVLSRLSEKPFTISACGHHGLGDIYHKRSCHHYRR